MLNGIQKIIENRLFKDKIKSFYKKYFYIKKHKGMLKYIFYYQLLKIYKKNDCRISIEADVKENIKFPNGLNGVLISEGVKIGENCVISNQVTIGAKSSVADQKGQVPEIGDNVHIGTGSKIIRRNKNRQQCNNRRLLYYYKRYIR